MRGLILRLQHIDSPAEQAVKVIEFYDTLVRNHAHLDDLLRATTGLTECTVGLTESASGRSRAFDASGQVVAHPEQVHEEAHMSLALTHRGHEVAELWLAGVEPSATDEIVLERLAIACDLLWVDGDDQMVARSVEAVLSRQVEDMHRLMHLRRLLINPEARVRVVAMMPTPLAHGCDAHGALEHVREQAGLATAPLHVTIGGCVAVIVPELVGRWRECPGWLLSVGPVVGAPRAWESWQMAQATLSLMARVPELTGPVGMAEQLATIAAMTRCHVDQDLPDVAAVRCLQEEHPHVVATVATLLRTGSLRSAGAQLHLHHSTVASRVQHFERVTGLSVDQPLDRLRALTAIIVVGTR